ncbi:DNA methyltransferase [Porphyromonas cangingivalis]|uniref:DNA methyltransferase n=1 Tax=Porphyromonas cangingivalis TaxID=36874 RepID=A0A0A2ENH6_PORCN|nr:THUMP domain-containing protein [Porphyromonas cangingivalis]KGN79247.1 DNA methyltransferase [Porphyromonas cangingivalis]
MEDNLKFKMIAKTMYGLEEILKSELESIGATEVEVGRRMVSFEGDKSTLYKANIHLRTALRVLVPMDTFEAANADEIYQYLYDNVDWSKYLTSRSTFAFDTVVFSEKFTHSKFVAYRAKDAISDYFQDREMRRPNVSVGDPDVRFHIHIANTTVTLALDSSGESLHKRGYRVGQNDAPISEVLAAGMLLQAGWDGSTDFVDPMCGSGTFLTEAALIALNIPPGIFRESYAFEKWQDFDAELLSNILDEWEERPFEHTIYGSDASPKAISIARANVTRAGVQKHVQLSIKSIEEYTADTKPAPVGLLMTNPPYGERLRPVELEKLYGSIGSVLKHAFAGYKAWVITSNIEGFDAIGLKHFFREKLFNGSLECELRGYELFEGKRNEFVKERVENNEEYAHAGEWTEKKFDRRKTDRPRSDRPRGERGERRTFGDKPRGERSFGEKKFGDRKFGDKPRDERPFGERKFGDRKFGDKPRSERAFGDRKFGDKPRGDRPFGERRFGERRFGDRRPSREQNKAVLFIPRSNRERMPEED